MGIFDKLLAPFSTQPQENAANAQIQGLTAGQAAAIPRLQNAYGTAQGNVTGARDAALGNVTGNYAAGLAPLNQNFETATAGTNALTNLLGFGPNGGAGVQDALRNTPGYQFTLNQGTQNVDRNQAATGALNSGNTAKAVADYTTGLADKTYQSAVGNLQPFWTGAQNTAGQISNLAQGEGNTLAGINTGAGNTLAGLATGLGNTTAGIDYGTAAGVGNANANAAMAPAQAGANVWGLGTNLAKLGVSPMPTGGNQTLAGGLFSNIFSPQKQGQGNIISS